MTALSAGRCHKPTIDISRFKLVVPKGSVNQP